MWFLIPIFLLSSVAAAGGQAVTGDAPAPAADANRTSQQIQPAQPAGTAGSDGPVAQSDTGKKLQEMQRLIDRGKAADAIAELQPMTALQPIPAGVEHLLGLAYYQQNNFSAAEAAFALAVEQDPADRESTQMRGITLYRMGQPGNAIPLLEKSSTWVSGANVDANYVLGLCYMDTRRYDDARKAFALQYGVAAESAAAYLFFSQMALREEFKPIAEASAKKALSIEPRLPLGHYILGELALASNQLDAAVAEFEQERQINPGFGGTYERLGDAYTRAGKVEQAQQALNSAVLLEPNSTGPYILLGKVLLKRNDPAMGATFLERAEHMDPSNVMTHMLLAQAYNSMGRTEDASRERALLQRIQSANAPKLETMH